MCKTNKKKLRTTSVINWCCIDEFESVISEAVVNDEVFLIKATNVAA